MKSNSKAMKTFSEVLVPFLSEKEIQLKKKSLNAYKNQTKVFCEWLKERDRLDIPICDIKAEEVSEFFLYLARDKDLDRPTCQKYYISIKAVFQYAKKRKEITELPFDLVVFPSKKRDCSARAMTSKELSDITSLIFKNDKQLYIAGMTQYYCGARPGREVRLLKARDYDLEAGVLKIASENAKKGKTRFITLSDDFIPSCREYGIDKANPDDYVFGCKKKIGGKPVSENMLRYRFNKYRDELGLSKDVKFYSFKHTSASRLIKIMDINSVKDFLGHSNITSTQKYIHRIGGGINEVLKYSFPSPTME